MMSEPRLALVDLARTAALGGMIVFHTAYDLQMFGLLGPQTVQTGWLWLLARLVAGSFLFLAGVSLWLAHGQGLRWPAFRRRLVRLVAAAAAVSLGTYIAFPQAYVFFGILHAIALFSLVGLALLRVPAAGLVVLALFFLFSGEMLRSSLFDAPALRFLGLSTLPAITVDFEPVFPWFGPFLLGMATGRLGQDLGLWPRLAGWPRGAWVRLASWPGRHSLAIYLAHQPVLIGTIWLILQLV